MALELVEIVLLVLALGLLVALHRKVSRIDVATWQLQPFIAGQVDLAEAKLYRQIESLHALTQLLGLERPLPPLRGWAGSPDFLLELARHVLSSRPRTIVECSSGASTLVAARCCQLNGHGHVYSLEHAEEYSQRTRQLIVEAGLETWATVIHAPLVQHPLDGDTYPWYATDELPDHPIDLVVVDGPPASVREQSRYPAGPVLIPRLGAHGVVVLDDASRPDEQKIIERWKREFPGLRADSREAEKGMVLLVKDL